MSIHRALCVLSLVSCCGCGMMGNWLHNGFKVGPDYFRPTAPVSPEWIDFNDRRVISEGVDEVAWWRVFNDPVIDNLVQTSYQQNLPLRVAGMRVLEAEARRGIAVGNLFPQQQRATALYHRTQVSAAGNNVGIPLPFRAFQRWAVGLDMNWELDLWGRLRRDIESANANVDASVENYDDVLVTLIGNTAAAYIQLREFEQRIEYAKANVKTQEGSLQIARVRHENGAVSQLDVTQAESSLAETQALVPLLEKGLRVTNNQLCILLGIPPRDLLPELGAGPIPVAPAEVVVGIPADLIRRRPDIRRAERDVAVQSAQIGVAAADLFPSFTITGAIEWRAKHLGDVFSSAATSGLIQPQFTWNVLNYGRILNNVRVQDALFQQLAIDYQQAVLTATAEVEDALVGFLKAQEQTAALEDAVRATQRSVEIALTQYRGGVIDFNRVFNLQSTLVVQQDLLATSQAEIAISLVRVYKALGGGWQLRLGGIRPLPAVEPEVLPPAAESNDEQAEAPLPDDA